MSIEEQIIEYIRTHGLTEICNCKFFADGKGNKIDPKCIYCLGTGKQPTDLGKAILIFVSDYSQPLLIEKYKELERHWRG